MMLNLICQLILKASCGALLLVLCAIIILMQGLMSSSMWIYDKCFPHVEVLRCKATQHTFSELLEEAKEVYQSYAQ